MSDIESGKRNPAKETLTKFAKTLGVTVGELESRDVRGPIEAAKTLFARKPEMVGAFLKVIEAAKKLDAEELVARVTLKSRQPEAPVQPPVPSAEVPAVSKPAAAPKAEAAKPEPKAEPKPAPEPKPSAQQTLF